MFDPISIIIFSLKHYIQRFTGIFSFIFDTYFPKKDESSDDVAFIAFL